MWPFTKKDSYNIDGREIVIQNKSKVKDIKFLIEVILATCKVEKIAKKFPKITFIIEEHKSKEQVFMSGSAWVNSDEIEEGLVIVHLNANEIIKNKKEVIKQKLPPVIVHELTHIWHDHTSKVMQKYIKITRKTSEKVRKKISDIIDEEPDLKEVRTLLIRFIWGTQIEGLADYCRYPYSFEERIFQKLYLIAKDKGEKTKELFEKFLINQDLKRIYEKTTKKLAERLVSMYKIGHHMVYSLMYINHEMDIEKVAKLSPYKFVKKYEAAMKLKGLRPVVSLTRGDGIIDYNRMVSEWWATAKRKLEAVKKTKLILI